MHGVILRINPAATVVDVCHAHVAEDGTFHGEVLHVDRFGNLITNLTRELLPMGQQLQVQIAGREVSGPVASYAQVREGELRPCLAAAAIWRLRRATTTRQRRCRPAQAPQ